MLRLRATHRGGRPFFNCFWIVFDTLLCGAGFRGEDSQGGISTNTPRGKRNGLRRAGLRASEDAVQGEFKRGHALRWLHHYVLLRDDALQRGHALRWFPRSPAHRLLALQGALKRGQALRWLFSSYTEVYSVIYDFGEVSLEHLLLSRNPSQTTNP